MRTRLLVLLLALVSSLVLPIAAHAQGYPSQPVKIVAPFPPGGGADIIARIFSQHLSASLGQPFVVENKPGAGTLLAVQQVMQAPADGHTLIAVTADTLAIASSLYRKPLVVPEKVLTPITQIVRTPLFLVVRADSPYRSMADVIAAARAAPGKLTFGSAGVGTIHHLASELLAYQAKFAARHVPYKGSVVALTDLVGGQIDFMFLDSPLALAEFKGTRIRGLAISAAQRLPAAAAVPTVAEQGLPGFEALTWMGFAAPLGTPADVVSRLHAAIGQAIALPEVSQRLRDMGLDPVVSASPAAFDAYANAERERWAKLMKEAKIEAE